MALSTLAANATQHTSIFIQEIEINDERQIKNKRRSAEQPEDLNTTRHDGHEGCEGCVLVTQGNSSHNPRRGRGRVTEEDFRRQEESRGDNNSCKMDTVMWKIVVL
ncbi:hypothetical protein PMAYCL1PPCAC_04162 [Pristionchus mayeri]|uniref:Uncharacterized protein n=1 Tax=Pristionchus mayeri TaxID=1317129 RepID=A0AAN4Z3P0_9BILA|nr:hypothetical protein PMAYCL1PPCAC_04162 [Pristionchus mayeri]